MSLRNESMPRGQNDGNGQNDYSNFQNTAMSKEMLNFGFSAGKDIFNNQRARLLPGVSDFFSNLKIYFAVSNIYVLRKLSIVLAPMRNQTWGRIPYDETARDGDKAEFYTSHKWALPKQDVMAPDLYIPLMSFITYALLIGLRKGLGSGFTPDILINSIWRCLILQLCETMVIKFGLSVMQVPLPMLDVFAYTGYKYVGLSLSTVARALGGTISLLVGFYSSASLGYFILKSMAAVVPASHSTGPPRHLMLLGFAAIQFFVSFILCTL